MRRREATDLMNAKVPPQALDLEEIIIGSILSDKEVFVEIAEKMVPDMFYKEANKIIYQHCQELALKSDPIDISSVMNSLKSRGELDRVGGLPYLIQCSDRVVSTANIDFQTQVVIEKSIKREVIKQAAETMEKCYNDIDDVFEIIASNDLKIDEIVNQNVKKKEVSLAQAFDDVMQELRFSYNNPTSNQGKGIPTKFKKLDEITGGLQNSDLIIIGARPGMGKTSLAMQIANNMAEQGYPGAVFSTEMPTKQLVKKTISAVTDIPLFKFVQSNLVREDFERIEMFQEFIRSCMIYIDDTSGLTLSELVAKSKRFIRKYGIKWILVDYLQFIEIGDILGKNPGVRAETEKKSKVLKMLAKELNIPIIALSQLSRTLESRPGNSKRPMLSDLRESGAIEQDADMVCFLYRPEYYGLTETEDGDSTDGLAELIIAKHRNGECGIVNLFFKKETTGFFDEKEIVTDFSFVNTPPQLPSNDMSKFANWDSPMLPNDGPF
ncbi:replicative DNA helicase [Sphingobacterium paramultivorum]|uniref:replicative DNA helicase n=1 Tax=Sphingobacterium paramultivorum TaxID=2886510 RepID=UPI00129C4CE5|nr:replicative DNA helicase [Sphingobacterium paramultivorum]